MTRSKEHLRVGTETREAGRARLRKHVVKRAPAGHRANIARGGHLTREPISDANRGDAHDGPAISEEEHEVTLHAQRPVVGAETVPIERVRLGTKTVTEQKTVAAEIRMEQIELDNTDDTNRS
jgi:hypothetical protein